MHVILSFKSNLCENRICIKGYQMNNNKETNYKKENAKF